MSSGQAYELGTAKQFSTWENQFEELKVRELRTQWKHKISVIPESVGITTKWWDYTAGVTRDGPSAAVPAGEEIYTTESGEYNVGDPALAGGGFRIGDTLPQSGAGDDTWCGYTNRLIPGVADADGAGVGVKYFNEGDGDEGGALSDGPQPYVWFRSSVTGVPDKTVPADQWNLVDDWQELGLDHFRHGTFIRLPFTFYDEGEVKIRSGIKTEGEGLDIKDLHVFVVKDDPMWGLSDLHWQQATVGSNITSYIDAAHFKAGTTDLRIRQNGEGRDGTVTGDAVGLSQGTPVPIISVTLRDGWENVNLTPVELVVDCNDSFYVFVSTGTDLTNANFSDPRSDIPEFSPTDSEFAVQTDNEATAFNNDQTGDVEYWRHVPSGGFFDTSGIASEMGTLGLAPDQIVTLGVVPIDATTFNGASLRWGLNF